MSIVLLETSHDAAEDGVRWSESHLPAIKPNELLKCHPSFRLCENCLEQPCRQQHALARDVDQDSLTHFYIDEKRQGPFEIQASKGSSGNGSLLKVGGYAKMVYALCYGVQQGVQVALTGVTFPIETRYDFPVLGCLFSPLLAC